MKKLKLFAFTPVDLMDVTGVAKAENSMLE